MKYVTLQVGINNRPTKFSFGSNWSSMTPHFIRSSSRVYSVFLPVARLRKMVTLCQAQTLTMSTWNIFQHGEYLRNYMAAP
jgi:hypothetical protein